MTTDTQSAVINHQSVLHSLLSVSTQKRLPPFFRVALTFSPGQNWPTELQPNSPSSVFYSHPCTSSLLSMKCNVSSHFSSFVEHVMRQKNAKVSVLVWPTAAFTLKCIYCDAHAGILSLCSQKFRRGVLYCSNVFRNFRVKSIITCKEGRSTFLMMALQRTIYFISDSVLCSQLHMQEVSKYQLYIGTR